MLKAAARGKVDIASDALASPTGFPFKVVQLPGTLSEAQVYAERKRSCDLGYLRTAYRKEDGALGWRCPAEREAAYVSKGGRREDLAGRRCLCAGLRSAAGVGEAEAPAIVTAGDTLRRLSRMLRPGEETYRARDVIQRMIGNSAAADAANA